ncbi:MAG: hypothetical protein ACFFBR_09655 [Promethearchaeota archaeon]
MKDSRKSMKPYLVSNWIQLYWIIQPPPMIDDFGFTTLMYNIMLGLSIIFVIVLIIIIGWVLTRMYSFSKSTPRDDAVGHKKQKLGSKLVNVVCIGIFIFLLTVGGIVGLTSPAGAVLPLFLAMVWGWWYLMYKVSWDWAIWPVQVYRYLRRRKKVTDKEAKKVNQQ